MQFPRPKNFPYNQVFYYDGTFALMKGRYKNWNHDSIGIRWMIGESRLGYPSTHGRAMWMVLPDKIAEYILEGINRDIATQKSFILEENEYSNALNMLKSRDIPE